MTGIIVTIPPTVEVPPGNNASNPSSLPPVTYQYAVLNFPQTWGAKQTFPLGSISVQVGDVVLNPGHVPGEPSNGSAAAGEIGEFITAQLVQASELTLVSGAQTNIISVSLTAGDWDVWGTAAFDTNAATVVSTTIGSISTTSAVLGLPASGAYFNVAGNVQNTISSTGVTRLSLPTTTTVYLVVYSVFTTNTQKAYGGIFARRAR